MICTLSNPMDNLGNVPAKLTDPWAFSTITCPDQGVSGGGASFTTITDPNSPRTYDFSNSLTLGDIMVSGFMVMFMFFAIAWGVYLLTFRRKY
jgi:hypothetical protein